MQMTNPVIGMTAVMLLLFATFPARAEGNLLTTPDVAAEAVKEIVGKIGGNPSASRIDITPYGVTLQVQGEKPFHVDEWRWQSLELWVFEQSYVSGPEPVKPSAPVDDISQSFFPLAEVRFDLVPEVVKAAIERAALEDEARVDYIHIERPVTIFPEPSFGEPRWTISVTSGRESASVYAALDGTVIGAHLSGTQRARLFDLFKDDSHLDKAKAELGAVLGPEARLRELSFSKTGIWTRTEHPSKKDYTVSYSWNLNGVKRDPIETPESAFDRDEDVTFAFSDLDFAVLPDLKKKAALEKLAMDGATIRRIEAERLVTGVREPQLSWVIFVEDKAGEEGKVVADVKGEILEVLLPESRRPKLDWLAGATVRATLDRIFAKFDKGTRFRTILINDEQGNVEVSDPLKPGELASFVVDDTEIVPFGTAFSGDVFGMGPDEPRMFTAEDMAAYDAATLDKLKEKTLERLKVKDGKIARLTFEKGNVFVASPRGQVLVEIRVDGPKGSNGGRVTYEPDGTKLDVVLP